MSTELIARVIMTPDTTVYIAFKDIKIVSGTPGRLFSLLTAPDECYRKRSQWQNVNHIINPQNKSLPDIPGLTLIKVYSDNRIDCIFPELFQHLAYVLRYGEGEHHSTPIKLRKQISDVQFSNEKDYLMKYFCIATNEATAPKSIERLLSLDVETSSEILREIFNTSLTNATIINKASTEKGKKKSDENCINAEERNEDSFITVKQYADKHNFSLSSVYYQLSKEKIPGAIRKSPTGDYLIPYNAEPMPKGPSKKQLENIKTKRRSANYTKTEKPLSGDAPYIDVQEKIRNDGLVSAKAREYIRTIAEYNYYTKHSYHEVFWNDRPAFIIDINPEYICKRLSKSNKELIESGRAPVVPGNDEHEFVIHHVGQKSESPFAIIPKYDHEKLSAIFHQGPASNSKLHGVEFENQKRQFWKTYLEQYEIYGTFSSIPSVSLSRTLSYYISKTK